MAAERSTLHAVAAHLVLALEPLRSGVADLPAFRTLLYRLGWEPTSLPPQYTALASHVNDALTALDGLGDSPSVTAIFDMLGHVRTLYSAITGLSTAPAGVDPAEFLSEIGRNLFDLLVVDYLSEAFPGAHSALLALGIIEQRYVEETSARPDFLLVRVRWDEVPKVLTEPDSIPTRVYGWGTDELDVRRLASHLLELFIALDWPAYVAPIDEGLSRGFSDSPANPEGFIDWALKLPVLEDNVGDQEIEVALALLELPAQGGKPAGLIVQPLVPETLAQQTDLGDAWSLQLRAGMDLSNQFGLLLRPQDVAIRFPFTSGAALPDAGFGLSLIYQPASANFLFGEPGKTRLEIGKATLSCEINLKAGEAELKVGAAPEAVALLVNTADLDGFLGSALGDRELRVEFPLGLSWSNRTGLNFVAGLGFEVSAYPHLGFRALRVDRVDLGLRFTAATDKPAELDVRVATALSGTIGPISYAVDRLGVHLPVAFADGNAGPVDIGFGILWPNGLGLVVDAGIVTGGGFIKLDPDKGRYFGMIDLKMFEIGVTAMAILDTKDAAGNALPPPGFSFFMAVSVELPPIQLGFGFTLNGVGGLAGINRRMNADAILSGVREGALESIMFPDDPVANASTIVSNLTTIFPVAMNRYVFGPMAMIGWGTPTLVRIELGIVLEVPAPVLLALLGKASLAIPSEEVAIISINLDVVGILDFGRSLFSVDATLRDSYITAFALDGDMAMRLSWAGKRNFAMAVGGLNPHFAPPTGFPTLRRITVALGMGDNPRVTLEGYFAVTSNSLQFGAQAELYAERAGFSIHGWLGFDALLIFKPLFFEFDFAAGMTLNRGSSRIAGITVRGTLTGPSPFHAKGEGCVSFFFFDVCVPFDHVFGEERAVDLPDKDPWPLLEEAIKASANWAAELGAGVVSAVSLRPAPEGSADLLLHPMGAATLRQKVLPFDRPLERFGEFDIVGPNRYDIQDVVAGDNDNAPWQVVTDHFAPGYYEKLSETDKLSRDSFEEMDAGVSVGSDLVRIDPGAMKVAAVTYETRIIDAGWKARILPPFLLDRALQILAGLRSAKAGSPLARSGRTRFAPDVPRAAGVKLADETYGVATVDTLAPRPDVASAATRGAAHLAIKTRIGLGARRADVQVVPTHELERAA